MGLFFISSEVVVLVGLVDVEPFFINMNVVAKVEK